MRVALPPLLTAAVAFVAASFNTAAQPTTSNELFAEWLAQPDTHTQVPNNSNVGYRRGEVALPNVPVVNNVVIDFDADPTGVEDSTKAFWRAIWDAGEKGGGAVFIPNGNYRIDGFLWMRFSGVVLRGESESGVHLHFTRHLLDVVGEDGTSTKSKYSWLGGLIWISGPNAFDVGYDYAKNYPETAFGTNWRTGRYASRRSEFWVDSEYSRTTLTTVSADAQIGDRDLLVEDASSIRPGMWIMLRFYISAENNEFQKQLAGSNHVANTYGWSFNSTLRYSDAKGYQWPVQVAAVDGNAITMAQPLRTAVKVGWQPHIIELSSLAPIYEAGVENLTIRLNSNNVGSYQHLKDKGWNGIFINRAVDCWVSNVTIADGENGVLVAAAKQVTVSNVTLTEFTTRANTWHHGFTARVMSSDLLFEDFLFDVNHRIDHGINSEAFSSGLVWRNGTMYKGTFDSHRVMPFDQIRTNVFVVNPAGSGSGGDSDNGPHAGKRLVHWNITAVDRGIWVNHHELFSGGALVGWFGPELTGCPGSASTVCGTPEQKNAIFLERNITPEITDLYQAQLDALRAQAGYVAIATPRAQTLTTEQGIPIVRIEGAAASGRQIANVELMSNGVVIDSTQELPWQFTWDTVPLGEHLLVARLTDSTGAVVESIPTRFVRSHVLKVDQSDPDLNLVGGWYSVNDPQHDGGTAMRNNSSTGAYIEYTFRGTRVVYYGYNTSNTTSNFYRVFINGEEIGTFQDRSGTVFQLPMWSSPELPDGVHTIRFQLEPHTANSSARGYFDFLEVHTTGIVGELPVAIVQAEPLSGTAPLEVSFNGASSIAPEGSTIVSWNWNFGDGNTDTGAMVSHTYTQSGSFPATLTVTTEDGVWSQKTVTVDVQAAPVATTIVVSPASSLIPVSGTQQLSAQVLDQFGAALSPQPASFNWSVSEGGSISSTGLFTSNGSDGQFTVTASHADIDGTALISVGNQPPVAVIQATPLSGPPPLNVQLNSNGSYDNDGTVVAYSWSSSDGQISTAANPSFSFNAVGSYSVTLTVTDNEGAIGSSEVTILVEETTANTFVEVDGVVVIEAENYDEYRRNSDSHDWSIASTGTGFTGEGFVEFPQLSLGNGTWRNSAEMIYSVSITNPGTYYLNIRRIAPSGSYDSLVIGVNNAVVNTKALEGSATNWAWNASARIVNLGHLSAGLNTIHILRRETGMKIDRIMIANNLSLLPQNTGIVGPEESPRTGGGTTPPPPVPPAVSLVSPLNGVHFDAGVPVTLLAEIEENDNIVQRVDFRLNGVLAGSSSQDPYELVVEDLTAGEYSATAEVIVDDLIAATSTPVGFIVEGSDPTDPTDPADGLAPLADAYGQGGVNGNSTYGSSNPDILAVKASNLNDQDFYREAFLRFAVPSAETPIESAVLKLYGNLNSTQSNNVATFAYAAVDNGWNEGTVTWNARPPRAYSPLDSQIITNSAPKYYEWNVTRYLQYAQERGMSSVTIVLANTQVSTPYAAFHSKENPSGNGPRLELTYAEESFPLTPHAGDWDPIQVSYFGGNSNSDRVVASFIRSDGKIVLVANYGEGAPGSVTPLVLGSANSNSAGMVVVMDEYASEVISVTRIAPVVVEAKLGPNDEILIAASSSGALLLDSSATQLLWHFDGAGTSVNIQRVSMAQDGHIATLSANPVNQTSSRDLHSGGVIRIFNPDGTPRSQWAAHLQAQNLTIDSNLGRIYTTGYNQTYGGPNPVQIGYVRSQNFDGDVIHWTAYDWRGDDLEPLATPGVTNNMADTRGYQVLIGPDGMLYAGFESAGGNHIMRYDPFDLNELVPFVGGDSYHQFFNSYSDHKMIIVRMDPITAEVDRFQQFTARVGSAGRTNGARLIRGQMAVDSAGRIHIVTDTASGGDTAATTFMVGLPLTYNPVPATEYGGGGAYLILSPDMTTRLHLSRVGSRVRPWTLHVRNIEGESQPRVIYGGATENYSDIELPTLNAFQSARGSTIDGYFVLSRPALNGSEPVPSSFAEWIADSELNVPSELRGALDTPANDGVPNLLKFFAGLDPLTPGSMDDVLWLESIDDGYRLSFQQHTRATHSALTIEISDDLVNWDSIELNQFNSESSGPELNHWSMPFTMDSPEAFFFRLGVVAE